MTSSNNNPLARLDDWMDGLHPLVQGLVIISVSFAFWSVLLLLALPLLPY